MHKKIKCQMLTAGVMHVLAWKMVIWWQHFQLIFCHSFKELIPESFFLTYAISLLKTEANVRTSLEKIILNDNSYSTLQYVIGYSVTISDVTTK